MRVVIKIVFILACRRGSDKGFGIKKSACSASIFVDLTWTVHEEDLLSHADEYDPE